MIRVLIVDDSASLRAMITHALNISDGIVVVGACADGADAPASAAVQQPDVILLLAYPQTYGN